VLSALGMLVAPRARQLSQSYSGMLDDINEQEIRDVFDDLILKGKLALREEGLKDEEMQATASVDVRYKGQSYTLNIPWLGHQKTMDSFHFSHEQRYGHRLEQAVETVTARVKVCGASQSISEFEQFMVNENQAEPLQVTEAKLFGIDTLVPIIQRDQLALDHVIEGPALITETVSTTFIDRGWQCHADRFGNLILHKLD